MYLQYLKYVLRHKWFVFIECCRLGIIWRGLIHDLSKFRPSEFIPYARWFYGDYGVKFNGGFVWEHREHAERRAAFDKAWLLHIHRNDHHWQWWLLKDEGPDFDGLQIIPMTLGAWKEMMADWKGAGGAITGNSNPLEWYMKNRDKMILDPTVRQLTEEHLGVPPCQWTGGKTCQP